MGRSAKLHKRVSKKTKAPGSSTASTPKMSSSQGQAPQVQHAKKKANLKEKSKATSQQSNRSEGEHVLGDVDYVSLMMGGRRKAKEEAAKLTAMEE
ncbi:hypothetical protein V5O48_006674 [Marasmius crinis-equi]|uniref:Uncharacterized protein n=1 Tax=Marasmius crinis-equi TaxID=585013 RepID=A0ABR3FJ95_9AGAR